MSSSRRIGVACERRRDSSGKIRELTKAVGKNGDDVPLFHFAVQKSSAGK
jgi:hypothetical protein